MVQKLVFLLVVVSASFVGLSSCNKDFLEKRQNSTITLPSKIEDYRGMLDVDVYMRETPVLGEIGSDDYYIVSSNWRTITRIHEKNQYIWAKEIFEGTATASEWKFPYQQVFYANVALDGLSKIPVSDNNREDWNAVKGTALFIRGFAFFNAAQIFSPLYDENDTNNPYGIPLRLSPNVEDKTARSTVKQTYDQIISDLTEARNLLPVGVLTQYKNRPTRPSADALLARVYLSMRQYEKAKVAANNVLTAYDVLLDFNKLSTTEAFPFSRQNDEILYQSNLLTESTIMTNLRAVAGYFVDSLLYRSYDNNDLRKVIYYSNAPKVKGSYAERPRFSGLATDEMWLIRAECLAREGDFVNAMKDLNTLLKTRWKIVNNQSTYVDYVASNAAEALKLILLERRKELAFRGLRWLDLKRLNREGAAISIVRVIDGVTYTLPPNDPRYVLPIPNDVIAFTGVSQNPR